ncbi:MAG: dynamin family protein, partial [Planctomycetia bacterium]|nr:dynamin family protein [Planctomycetia bacterium]
MSSLKESIVEALDKLLEFIDNSPWRNKYFLSLQTMRKRLDEPCVLAVAGRVKAGKSSFLNAFLGQDLALVGVTETTATINYFRFGKSPDPNKPVKCVWDNGTQTWEDQAFLDSLQGNTIEVLRRAAGIKHLEFFLDNPKLEQVQLVDTPGTGAVVGDDGMGHQNVTAEFFQMSESLRKRHDAETQALSSQADAVIYLTGSNVRDTDAEFLSQFQQNSGGSSLNMLGILAKADMCDSLLTESPQRKEYIDQQARQLGSRLNVPIPLTAVSSGIERTIQKIGREGLDRLREKVLNGFDPKYRDIAFSQDTIYRNPNLPGCTLSVEEREALLDGIPWRVFQVIVKTLIKHETDEAIAILNHYSGFEHVNQILEKHFFERGELLRCHTVLLAILKFLRYNLRNELFQYGVDVRQNQEESAEYLRFVLSHPQANGNPLVERFRMFLSRHLPEDNSRELESKINAFLETFEGFVNQLDSIKR